MLDAVKPGVLRRLLSAGSFREAEERKPKHIERNSMIGLRSDRGVDRETIDECDDDIRQQLNRDSWTKFQKRK